MSDEPGRWDDWELQPPVKKEFVEMFKRLDKDNDGYISGMSIPDIIYHYQLKMPEKFL